MAGAYGRGNVASSSRAQSGDTGASTYLYRGSKNPSAHLSGTEQVEMAQSRAMLGRDLDMKHSGVLKNRKKTLRKHKAAIGNIERLRNLALDRAFSEYQTQAIQHSKPWLQREDGGLIGQESVKHSLAGFTQFGGQGSPVGTGGRDARREALAGEQEFDELGVKIASHRLRPTSFG